MLRKQSRFDLFGKVLLLSSLFLGVSIFNVNTAHACGFVTYWSDYGCPKTASTNKPQPPKKNPNLQPKVTVSIVTSPQEMGINTGNGTIKGKDAATILNGQKFSNNKTVDKIVNFLTGILSNKGFVGVTVKVEF